MTTIIGLVSDAAYNSMREPAPPTSYVHLGLAPVSLTISVHVASGHSARVAGAVAKTLTTLNPDLAFSFRTLDDQVSSTLTQDRVLAMLSGFFGSLALLIAALGIYGVAAEASHDAAPKSASVWRSAPRRSPWSAWLCHAWPLVAVGVLAGAAFSLWASQFIGALLYGLTPRDPMTLAGAATVLAMVAAVAASVPAWRASRIDPAEVLRDS
jgi:nitrate reductase NapE component